MRSKPRLIMAATQILLACFATTSLPTSAKSEISKESVQSCADGISLVYRGNFETGITQLERAISLSPQNEIALAYLAYAHNREGARIDSNPLAALHEFCTAIFIDSTNEKAKANSKKMIQILGKNPNSADDRLTLARQAILAKDYVSAIVEFESSLVLKENADARNELADAYKLAASRPKPIHPIDINAFMSALESKIKSNWKPPAPFPPQALTIALEIDATGAMSKLRLLTPSKYKVLNQSVLKAVEQSAPFSPLPVNSEERATILFTYNYMLNGFKAKPVSSKDLQKLSEQSEESAMKSDIEQFTFSKDIQKLVDSTLRLAVFYENKDRPKEAKQLLLKAQSLQDKSKPLPSLPETLNELTRVYIKQSQFDLAEPLIKQSISLCEAHPELGLFKLARANNLYGLLLLDTEHEDQAKICFERATKLLHQQKPTIEEYDKLIANDPIDAVNYFLQAKLYNENSDWLHAIPDLDKAIELNPRYVYAYTMRANVNEELKKDDEALKDIQKAKEIDPSCENVCLASAQFHSRFKQWDIAITELDKAIELEPKAELLFMERGNAYKELKDYQRAMKDFNQAIALQSGDPRAYLARGQGFLCMGQYKSALADFETALRYKPDSAFAYRCVGIACNEVKDYDRSVKSFDKCLNLDDKQKNVFLYRGYALGQLGQFDRAVQDFTSAIKENPNSVANYGDRSWAFYCLQDYQHA